MGFNSCQAEPLRPSDVLQREKSLWALPCPALRALWDLLGLSPGCGTARPGCAEIHGHAGSLSTKLAFQGNSLNASQTSHAQPHRALLLPSLREKINQKWEKPALDPMCHPEGHWEPQLGTGICAGAAGILSQDLAWEAQGCDTQQRAPKMNKTNLSNLI